MEIQDPERAEGTDEEVVLHQIKKYFDGRRFGDAISCAMSSGAYAVRYLCDLYYESGNDDGYEACCDDQENQ